MWNDWNRHHHRSDGQGEVVLGEYRYNAAHWRVEKIEPSPGGTGVLATRFVYDASWRPILEESIDDYDEQTADWEYAARARNVWGLRYIDEVLARAWGAESDESSEDERFTDILHYVSDPQFSVIAVLDRDGLPIERVRYDAYGNARHSPLGDITGDGMVGTADSEAIATLLEFGSPEINDPGYMAEADFNLDGVLDDTDAATVFEADPTPPLAPGRISAFGNPFGYTGAYFDAATGMYLMRHRHYSPELGRWAQRDPAGYVDGKNLYEYVRSGPTTGVDPWGLSVDDLIDVIKDSREQLRVAIRINVNQGRHNEMRGMAIFFIIQDCILDNLVNSCLDCNDPDVDENAAWLAGVVEDFMTPLIKALRQRASNAAPGVTVNGWKQYFDRWDDGEFDNEAVLLGKDIVFLEQRIRGHNSDGNLLLDRPWLAASYWAAHTHIETDLFQALLNNGVGDDDLWDCVGDVVSGCETAFANGLLGSTVGGVAVDLGDLVKRWKEDLDIGVKRDKMRERARHILH